MRPTSIAIALALLLLTQLDTAHAGDATGTWEHVGPAKSGMRLRALQQGAQVRFELEVWRGAPSYNSGWAQGEFALNGNTGVFRSSEYGACEITFEFAARSVRIAETDDQRECGFGHNVHADGTLPLKSRRKPKFS